MKEFYMDFNTTKDEGSHAAPEEATPVAPKPGPQSGGVQLTSTQGEATPADPTAQDTKDETASSPLDLNGVQYTEEPRYTGNLKSSSDHVETVDTPDPNDPNTPTAE